MYEEKVKGSQIHLYDNLLSFENVTKSKAQNLLNKIKPDKKYDIEIKEHTKKRSLSMNAYCWVLCDKIAQKVGNTKDNIYDMMIKRVAPFIIYPCWEEILEDLLAEFDHYEVINARYHKDGRAICDIKIYRGSSRMNSKEMARLLDEIISECKLQNIETDTPEQLAEMKSKWRV